MHIIEEAFGKKCNLYTDVLGCTIQSDNATLRKAYYRTALKYHPDKNPEQPQEAAKKFHAITAAYQILCNAELRKEYDETGIIPNSIDDDDDDDNGAFNADNPWKDYFDRIFGKVSVSHIEAFAIKYKCSSEEQRDVLQQYVQQKGNLLKMINHVMLSEFCDASRWVEDYIQPAIDAGTVSSQYNDTMQKTLQQCKKKAEKDYKEKLKESKSAANEMDHDDDDDDDDEEKDDDEDDENDDEGEDDDDETEEEEEEVAPSKNTKSSASKQSSKKSSMSPRKAQPTVTKRKTSTAKTTKNTRKSNSNKNDMSDLVAMIQNKNKKSNSSSNTWSTFGARYGVSINDDDDDDDDPIKDDTVFAKVQSKLKNNHQRNKKSK